MDTAPISSSTVTVSLPLSPETVNLILAAWGVLMPLLVAWLKGKKQAQLAKALTIVAGSVEATTERKGKTRTRIQKQATQAGVNHLIEAARDAAKPTTKENPQ